VLAQRQYELFEHWYYLAVRELIACRPFSGNYAALAGMVVPEITAHQAKQAVAVLDRLSLIVKDNAGVYHRAEAILSTGGQVHSVAVTSMQQAMTDLAKEAYDRFPQEERTMSTLTLSVSNSMYPQMVEELAMVRNRYLEMARACNDPDRVYQCNFAIFPLSRIVPKERT
jgi:uncharacterized protein (TIGR02147 family)